MKKITLMITLMVLLSQTSFAQSSSSSQMTGIRRNVATVIFAGLGGAVLGLSTLSFYNEPQDHVGNIWFGLGLGIIAGTTYVSMKNTDYSQMEIPTNPNQLQKHRNAPQLFVYNFEF